VPCSHFHRCKRNEFGWAASPNAKCLAHLLVPSSTATINRFVDSVRALVHLTFPT